MVAKQPGSAAPQVPTGCTLCEDQLAGRMQAVASVFAGAEELRELPDGYEFRFPGTSERATQLTEFINGERACCVFFQFELAFEPNQGPVWFRLRGSEHAKEFIRTRINTSSRHIRRQEGAHNDLHTNGHNDSHDPGP